METITVMEMWARILRQNLLHEQLNLALLGVEPSTSELNGRFPYLSIVCPRGSAPQCLLFSIYKVKMLSLTLIREAQLSTGHSGIKNVPLLVTDELVAVIATCL